MTISPFCGSIVKCMAHAERVQQRLTAEALPLIRQAAIAIQHEDLAVMKTQKISLYAGL
jgi:hypothetical protein